MASQLNYEPVGATRPDSQDWAQHPSGYRRYERTVRIGHGETAWNNACAEVLAWAVKTRSGFTVHAASGGDVPAKEGADYEIRVHLGPFTLKEPVRVVAIVDTSTRCGFAYGTKTGHPVSGEEAFIVHRSADGTVWLTLRSLARPARGAWGYAFPVLLLAQRQYRRRYLRALTADL